MKPLGRKNYGSIPHLSNSKLGEGNQANSEPANCAILEVRQRCIDFANWIKKQNLMICAGYDENDCNWRSSMIGGKKFTDEQLYDIFERGGNVD